MVEPQTGRIAIGLAVDRRTNYLFVAGGGTGEAYIYDAATGANIAEYQFTTDSLTFVQDVVVTRSAAYFTDSFRPYIYRVPLSNSGDLPNPGEVEEIPLSGDFVFIPMAFNSNGIDETSNETSLVIVNSETGKLYTVDPNTGDAVEIDLARIFHEWLAATADMTVLPGVLARRTLRRTVQVRLGSNSLRLPGGAAISTVSRRQFMKHPG